MTIAAVDDGAPSIDADAEDGPAIDAIYDAPYIIFVYAAWAGASLLFGETVGLCALIGGTVVLTAAGIAQPAPGFRPHSFAADMATTLLFCSAAIGAGWFVLEGLTAEPTITLLGLGATLAGFTAVALAEPDD